MSVVSLADAREDAKVRVRKELVGAMAMLLAHRESRAAQTRLKAAITDAHGHGQLTHDQTQGLIKLYDLEGA